MNIYINLFILFISIIIGYEIYKFIWLYKIKILKKLEEHILNKEKYKITKYLKKLRESYEREIKHKKRVNELILKKLEKNNEGLKRKLELREKDIESYKEKIEILKINLKKLEKDTLKLNNINKKLKEDLFQLENQILKELLLKVETTEEKIKKLVLNNIEEKIKIEKENYVGNKIKSIEENLFKIIERILLVALQKIDIDKNTDISNIFIKNPYDSSFIKRLLTESILNLFNEKIEIKLGYDNENNSIIINSPDGYKREIARRVLDKIIKDKEINFIKILENLKEIEKNVEKEILINGEKACKIINITLPSDLCKILGKLKYRTSFGQNILEHSIEVGLLAKLIALEIGIDYKKASKTGLLHDIGKALDHEKEGGHPEIGASILKEYNEDEEIIIGVEKHHESIQNQNIYALIVNIADAISASRPGARRETFEKYLNRLQNLESIAYTQEGIENAYAISAGREIRVIVDADKISDEKLPLIAKNIANQIEKKLFYPGTIKVTVIREKRIVEYAI